jgi:S1-C subfamily serine protease
MQSWVFLSRRLSHLLFLLFLFSCLTGISPIFLSSQAQAAKEKLSLSKVLLLLQIGYKEDQIKAEIRKHRMQGRFALSPAQALKLRKAGASFALIRFMGIAGVSRTSLKTGPVSLKEVRQWLKAKKSDVWMTKELNRRGVKGAEFGPAVFFELQKEGLSLGMMQLLFKLKKRSKPTPRPVVRLAPRPRVIPVLPVKPRTPVVPRPVARRPLVPAPAVRPADVVAVRLSKKRVYRPITADYSMVVPKGWQVREVAHANETQPRTYFLPNTGTLQNQKAGFWISVETMKRDNKFLSTRTLKELMEIGASNWTQENPGLRQRGRIKSKTLHGYLAVVARFRGSSSTLRQRLVYKFWMIRVRDRVFTIAVFATPGSHRGFFQKVRRTLRGLSLPSLRRQRKKRTKRLAVAMTRQAVIAANTRSVVQVSCRVKMKNGKKVYIGMGTGFVISKDGYVITNHHVVVSRSGRQYKHCMLNWDRETRLPSRHAVVVAAFRQHSQRQALKARNYRTGRTTTRFQKRHVDIALLKITTKGSYRPVSLTPIHNAMLGDNVIAMGFPTEGAGLRNLGSDEVTATSGSISRFNRLASLDVNEVQHTAKVAGGNSGGPLFDVHTGGVIGINTWVGVFDKRAPRPTMGLGFYYSLPINLVWRYFPDYIQPNRQKLSALQWYSLGLKWRSQGLREPARRAFKRALYKRPAFTLAYKQLAEIAANASGKAYGAKRKALLNEARSWADRGLRRDPGNDHLRRTLALVALLKNEWQTARFLLRDLRRKYPRNARVHSLWTLYHGQRGKISKALKSADRIIRLAPRVPFGYLIKGRLLYGQKRFFEGQQVFRQILQFAPTNLEARIMEAWGYQKLNLKLQALARFQKLYKLHPNEPVLAKYLMLVYVGLSKKKKALKMLNLALRLYQLRHQEYASDPELLYVGGLLFRVSGSKIGKRLLWGFWGQLLVRHPRSSLAYNAGLDLAIRAAKAGYKALAIGLLNYTKGLDGLSTKQRTVLQKTLLKVRNRGLTQKELRFMLLVPIPRFPVELSELIFRATPSLLSLKEARWLFKRRVPGALLVRLLKLSKLRRKMGVVPAPRKRRRMFRRRSTRRMDRRVIRSMMSRVHRSLRYGRVSMFTPLWHANVRTSSVRSLFRTLYNNMQDGTWRYVPTGRIRFQRSRTIGYYATYSFRLIYASGIRRQGSWIFKRQRGSWKVRLFNLANK